MSKLSFILLNISNKFIFLCKFRLCLIFVYKLLVLLILISGILKNVLLVVINEYNLFLFSNTNLIEVKSFLKLLSSFSSFIKKF